METLKEQPPPLRSQELHHTRFVSTPEDTTLQSHPQGHTAVVVGGGGVLVKPRVEAANQSFLQTEVSAGILSQPPVSHTHSDSGSTRPGLTLLKTWLTREAGWPPSSPRDPPSLLPGTGIARACRNIHSFLCGFWGVHCPSLRHGPEQLSYRLWNSCLTKTAEHSQQSLLSRSIVSLGAT